jgi:hypothetical protein
VALQLSSGLAAQRLATEMASDEFPLRAEQEKILEATRLCPGRGKHCASNAVHHLRRGWAIRRTDPAMAVFRAMTAEEEAAGAIFYALVRHKYAGAAGLRYTSHEQKAAVRPFVEAILHFIALSPVDEPTVALERQAGRLKAITRFAFTDFSGKKYWLAPRPPLHFVVKRDGRGEGFGPVIDNLLARLASRRQFTSISTYIEHAKNERNRLLYAGDTGYPDVRGLRDEYFFEVRRIVFRHPLLYLLIDQYRTRQNFVQQALDAFLRVTGTRSKQERERAQ